MVFENQLRRAVNMRREHLINHLKALSIDDDTPFENLTLSDLEREWDYYMNVNQATDEAN